MKKTAGSVLGKITLATVAMLAAAAVYAVERTYSGTDGKWTTASNWSPNGVPAAGDTAKFTANATITESFTLPSGVITIWNTTGTLTLSGVIGGEGAAIRHKGGTLVLGESNTFTGSFTNESGNVTAPKLADGGTASSFGAGYGPINFRDGQITVTKTCSTDRHFYYSSSQFNVSSGATLTFTGGFHGNMWQRSGGIIKFNCYLDSTVSGMGRTDSGAFYFNCPTNTFTATPKLSNGTFYYCSLSNKNVACSLGTGTSLQFGQAQWTTPGTFSYSGDVDVMCDRDITINSTDGTISGYPGGYSKYDGPYFETQKAGVKQTFTGTITLGNAKAIAPFIKFKGAGDGEITASIPTQFNVYKSGAGTWTLSGQNAATGRLELAAGRIDINGSYAEGATITVASGATLGGTGTVHSAATFSNGSILAPGTANECGLLDFDARAPVFANGSKLAIKVGDGTNDVVHFAAAPTINGNVTISLSSLGGGSVPEGQYTVMTYDEKPSASFVLDRADGYVSLGDDALVVTIIKPSLVWQGDGVENVWDATTANWSGGALYSDGSEVMFDDTGSASPAVTILAAGVRPGLVAVSADSKEYAFTGGPIAGTTEVVKSGAAPFVISNDWTFAGNYNMLGGTTTLAGRFNGPSIVANGTASLVQTKTSKISGENIEISLAHGKHALMGTNDFTGSVTLDASAISTPNTSFEYCIFNPRTFGFATNVTLAPKYENVEAYTYLRWSNSVDVAKETALSVRRFGEVRWAALALPNNVNGAWRGDIRAVGQGVDPGLAFYSQWVGACTLKVGTLGETVVAGFGEHRFRGAGTIRFYSRFECPESYAAPNDGTTLYFYAPGNVFRTFHIGYGRVCPMTNFAFSATTAIGMGKDSLTWGGKHWADFDLNGTTQTVASVNETNIGKGGYRRITSTLPATLVVSGAVNCAFGSVSTNGNGYITGAVSIVKDGTSTWTLNGTNTFTGTVTVKGGTLCANSAKALPETTTLTIGAADGSAGVLKLDKDQTVSYLCIGDKCKAKGVYGGPDSNAPRKLACFSGTATLTILREIGGTMLIFR